MSWKPEFEFLCEFAGRLRTAMLKKHLTQADISDAVGVSRQVVCRYVNGLSAPSYPTLIALCKTLGVSADYLLGLEV